MKPANKALVRTQSTLRFVCAAQLNRYAKEGNNMNNELLKRALKICLGLFIFVLVLGQLVGWAVTEKPWLERLWISAFAGGGFGVIGAGVGLVIGGIGFALGGGAFGLAGWLVFGVLGFGAGALGGSLWTIISDPQNFDFDYFRLTAIVVIAAVTALVGVLAATTLGRNVRDRI